MSFPELGTKIKKKSKHPRMVPDLYYFIFSSRENKIRKGHQHRLSICCSVFI